MNAKEVTAITTALIKYTDFVHSETKIQVKLQVMSFKVCKCTGVLKRRMLKVIKRQRDANKFTLYRIVLLRVVSMVSIFPHSITPLKVVGPHSSKSVRMHHLTSLLSFFSKQFQLPKHRFNQRQYAPFSFLAFKIVLAVATSKTPF